MADEPIVAPIVEPVVASAAEPAVAPEGVVAPVVETNYFGTDGVLNEGWRGTLEEDLREDKSLLSFKSVGDLAKSFVNTKKMVGADVIAVLSDTSTQGEIEAFHIAGGRPVTVADYNLTAPEGFPEEIKTQIFPEGRLEKWQERFFKGGVSKKAADAFIAEFTQDILADYKNVKLAEETAMAELTSGLSVKWGAAFEQNKHLGNMAIEEGTVGDDALKERLLAKPWINDPDFVEYSSNLGTKFAEGKPPGFGTIPTPNDYQDQIDEIRANPLLTKGTEAERMKLARKLEVLYKLKTPEPVNT